MSWLRACANCSRSWGWKDLFCESCWEELWKGVDYQNNKNKQDEFNTSSLLSWGSNCSVVGTFARAQKGEGLTLARQRVVEQYLPLIGGPIPSRLFYVAKNNKRDHGYEWALAFAQSLHRPLHALSILDIGNYKIKNRKQRNQEGRVLAAVDIQKNEAQGSWFVDDIRTTGATARSAWRALGKPESFRTVVIVQRLFYEKLNNI